MKTPPYTPPAALTDALAHDPLVIVDVGARGGPQPIWASLSDHLTWVGFEPDARSAAALSDLPKRSHILTTALSNVRGRAILHRTRDEGDSSLLRPNAPFLSQFGRPERFDVVDTIELDVDTLDHQLAATGIDRVDVLKLDTQGSELAILQGARQVLAGGVIALDVEVEFSRLYEDQPLFADVDALVRPFDLQLMDLTPKRWIYAAGATLQLPRGQVVWGEALYFATMGRLQRELAAASPAGARVLVTKTCMVALVYGFADYALFVLESCAKYLEAGTTNELRQAVAKWDAQAPVPRVPMTVELTPEQMRALTTARQDKGVKPTQQVRRLIEQWMKTRL